MVKAKLTLPAYELPDGTLLYTAPVDTPQDPKQAAIEQVSPTHYDQTALELCEVCGWKTLIPGDCCLNCERGNVEQEPVDDDWTQEDGKHLHEPVIAPVAAPQREYGRPMVIGELTKLAEGHSHCFEVPDTLPEGKYEIVLRAALKERGE